MPTLKNGDNLWVEKISPKLGSFHYGEIVTVSLPMDLRKKYTREKNPIIKRVIAVSGDKLQVKDGKVYVNGKLKQENYINGQFTDNMGNPEKCDLTVPAGYIYVMGDNRGNSTDSRIIGPVKKSWVIGRVILRFLPIKSFGTVR